MPRSRWPFLIAFFALIAVIYAIKGYRAFGEPKSGDASFSRNSQRREVTCQSHIPFPRLRVGRQDARHGCQSRDLRR